MPIPYEQVTVHTPDGFSLSLFRSRPLQRHADARPPVLLLPGFSSNRYTFGVRREHSLPTALNNARRDVWIGELRGSRSSRWLGRGRPLVDVDAKLHLDVPALIEHVQRATGAEQVDVIGHSLGGLLALLAAGGPDGARIARVVTLATPGTFKGIVGSFEAAGPVFQTLARGVERVASQLGDVAIAPLARTRGPVPHLFALRRHFLPGACDAAVRRLYLDHAVESVHGPELAQLTRWVREGVITDREGRPLEHRLRAVAQPALIIAATRDKVSPEANAFSAYAKIGSADKHFRAVSRARGARRDYAHADLLLAETARLDVHEPIVDWLAARDPRSLAAPAHPGAAAMAQKNA